MGKSHCSSKNVSNLWPAREDFRRYLEQKWGHCGELPEKQQCIRLVDSAALKGGVAAPPWSRRASCVQGKSSTIKSYNVEDNEKFRTIVAFECRGLEPVDFQPQAGFAAEGVESRTIVSDINLQEKDWTDYDEKAQESGGIYAEHSSCTLASKN